MKETKEAIHAYQGYASNRYETMSEEYKKYIQQYVLRIHFNGKADNGKTVDFGGSAGESTRLLKNVTVVEIDQEARDIMDEAKIPNHKDMNPIKDESIDTIYSSHVLEHVENPIDHLKEFYNKLKLDGNLILVIPLEGSRLDVETIDPNGHLFAWNETTINTLVTRAGFVVEQTEYAAFGSVAKIIGWDNYTKLIKNRSLSILARLCMLVRAEVIGLRYCGELIIRAKKVF